MKPINMLHIRLNIFAPFQTWALPFLLVAPMALFIQCSDDEGANSNANCEVTSASIQFNGNDWGPCGGGFSTAIFPGGSVALNFHMNDAASLNGKSYMLAGSIFSYTGPGAYEPSLSSSIWTWSDLADLQVVKVYTAQSGTMEILQQDDERMKAKIDCVFSDNNEDVSIKGEFEVKTD